MAGEGLVTVVTGPDTHIINSGTNPGESTPTLSLTPGITAESGGHAAAGSKITATVASTIEMFGPATANPSFLNNPVALRSIARVDAPISVTYTGPGITTSGGGGIGILAYSNGPASSSAFGGSGSVTINSSGPITTNGTGALGIVADSGKLRNELERETFTTRWRHHGHGVGRDLDARRCVAWHLGKFNDQPRASDCDKCVHHGTVQRRDQRS